MDSIYCGFSLFEFTLKIMQNCSFGVIQSPGIRARANKLNANAYE
jgi:hypothetical protein